MQAWVTVWEGTETGIPAPMPASRAMLDVLDSWRADTSGEQKSRGGGHNAEVKGVLTEVNEVLQEVQEVHTRGTPKVHEIHGIQAGGTRRK